VLQELLTPEPRLKRRLMALRQVNRCRCPDSARIDSQKKARQGGAGRAGAAVAV